MFQIMMTGKIVGITAPINPDQTNSYGWLEVETYLSLPGGGEKITITVRVRAPEFERQGRFLVAGKYIGITGYSMWPHPASQHGVDVKMIVAANAVWIL